MSREVTVAEGRLQKPFFLLVFLAVVIGVGTWYPQFGQGYEVKNSAKLGCNDVIKQFRFNIAGEEETWRNNFLRRCTQAGVNLKPTQYSFVPSHDRQTAEYVCKVKISYQTKSEWAFIGDIFALEPIMGKKVIQFEHRVRDSY